MNLKDRKEYLRECATQLIRRNKFYGESYYLRKLLRTDYDLLLSQKVLRTRMQELAEQGHFVRSDYPWGGQGYTWSLPENDKP